MNKTKIAIFGYGSMGKEIEKQAIDSGFTITDIFHIDNKFDPAKKYDFDVAIEFTQPDAVFGNVKDLASAGKNIVVGTTGWYHRADEMREIAQQNDVGIVWASNFSVGMNMFFKIVEYASKLAEQAGEYDIMLHELHHKRKKDSPSGTAESLGKLIIENFKLKNSILTETAHEQINPEQLHVTSTRGGEIFGTHTVYIDSLPDTIELTHRARSRAGFAGGALKAAELIHNKKGFYEFSELLF